MKINVGPRARIVGTKRVSSEGAVRGLSEFEGREVLIVVPSRTPQTSPTMEDYWIELRRLAETQGRKALQEYKQLRKRYGKTRLPLTKDLLAVAPPSLHPSIKKADVWLRAQAEALERRADRLLRN